MRERVKKGRVKKKKTRDTERDRERGRGRERGGVETIGVCVCEIEDDGVSECNSM